MPFTKAVFAVGTALEFVAMRGTPGCGVVTVVPPGVVDVAVVIGTAAGLLMKYSPNPIMSTSAITAPIIPVVLSIKVYREINSACAR